MELHLELFPSKSGVKTLLLFVLRDHTQKTSLAQFGETLTRDVQKIWNDIQKPDAYKDTPLSDLFDLDFCSLPHKVPPAPGWNFHVVKESEWYQRLYVV